MAMPPAGSIRICFARSIVRSWPAWMLKRSWPISGGWLWPGRSVRMLSQKSYADPRSLGFSAAVAGRLAQAGAGLTLQRERRFALVEENVLVNGSLDRVVLWQTAEGKTLAADLIDFKTDRAGDETRLAERVEFYRPQIAAYRRAIERLHRLEPAAVVGRLVFLDGGHVRRVD